MAVNQVTMLPVIHFSSSGQEKWFQVDFDYIYDSEGLSVEIFSPHKAVRQLNGAGKITDSC